MAFRWLSRTDLEADEGYLERRVYDEKLANIAREAWPSDSRGLVPVVFDYSGEINHHLTEFAMKLNKRDGSEKTISSYAIEADVFVRYLEKRNLKIESVLEQHLYDYRASRLWGDLEIRITRRSWNKIAVVIRKLCDFSGLNFPDMEWDRFRYGGRDDDQVRMISLGRYLGFRRALGTVSRAPLRNMAFAELLVTTGLRCEEAASLLKCEVPALSHFGEGANVRVWISEMIAKNRKGRYIEYARRVAGYYMRNYVEEERSHHVMRAINRIFPEDTYSGSHLSLNHGFVFFRQLGNGFIKVLNRNGEFRTKISSLSVRERRVSIEVEKACKADEYRVIDFGPLWIAEGGSAMRPRSWNAIFAATSDKMKQEDDMAIRITPHMLRHTFAVFTLNFLLKGLIEVRKTRSKLDRRGEVYDKIVGDPLRTVQTLLGHGSIDSTMIYLKYVEDNQELVRDAYCEWDEHLSGGYAT